MDLLGATRPGRYAVVDVETTGFSPASDRVVEVACVLLQDGRVERRWSSLVRPGRPIPWRATQVHGITDADVAPAPPFDQVERRLLALCAGATVVAHNASFDLSFLAGLRGRPYLCTLALARRAFPDAPNHRNQTLRRYLGIDRDPMLRGLAAHRALADAQVTAAILLRCLARLGSAAAYGSIFATRRLASPTGRCQITVLPARAPANARASGEPNPIAPAAGSASSSLTSV